MECKKKKFDRKTAEKVVEEYSHQLAGLSFVEMEIVKEAASVAAWQETHKACFVERIEKEKGYTPEQAELLWPVVKDHFGYRFAGMAANMRLEQIFGPAA